MAIFPNIEAEDIVQVGDRTRIDVSKSFVTPDEATTSLVRVDPETGVAGFIDITSVKGLVLDWEYSTDGDKVITVEVTTDGLPVTKTLTISAITEADDKLFSDDYDLKLHESDILKYVEKGRNTFKNTAREAQTQILEWLYRNGYTDFENNRLTKASVIDIQEVKEWSRFMVLMLIMDDQSNQIGDIFHAKARMYESMMQESRTKAILKIDTDGDGSTDGEGFDLTTRKLIRV